jgi:2-methylcitrate dehydratase
MIMDLAGSLSEYAVSLRYSDLSEHAVHTAKRRLVDTLGRFAGAPATVPMLAERPAPSARLST